MRAMVLNQIHKPLQLVEISIPEPEPGQVLIQVATCGVCRTDIHAIDGELPSLKLPLILGHQVVGSIIKLGSLSDQFKIGDRVGCPWLAKTCQNCSYCLSGQENLCDHALYRGYQVNGGFAEYCVADQEYIYPIPSQYSSEHAAPLLCAGLIGYRSYRMAGEAHRIGFYGFGAAAHILIQVALHQGKEVYAFTRKGDAKGKEFAKKMGAIWTGDSDQSPPHELDAAIIFAPAGELIPLALQTVRKGGSVICAGIYMTDIPSFPYRWLYGERILRSVTNLTRTDGVEFFKLIQEINIETTITCYPLENANEALADLKNGHLSGSAVLRIPN